MSKKAERTFLLIVFLFALLLRLGGVKWGLPYPYGFDGFFLVKQAVGFFSGDFNPHEFVYPAFHKYFLFFVYTCIYAIGKIGGHFSSLDQFRSLLDIDPSIFIVSGRVVAAFLGSASVVLCYILAKRLFSRGVAFLSLLFGILPLEVLNAHYCTSDTPLTFWLLAIFIFCARIMEKPNLRYYILAGIFTGIAGGTKYPGLVAVLIIMTAHLLRLYNSETGWRAVLLSEENHKLIIALALAGLVFFISTPYVFLDYKHSLPNIIGQFKIRYTGVFDIYQRANENQIFAYVKVTFFNFGFLFALLGLWGAVLRLRKISREEILLLSWIIPFAVMIHVSHLKPPRYFLTISPFLLIFLSKAMLDLKERLGKRISWSKYPGLVIAGLIILQPLYYSIKNDIILIKADTREQAHDWILKNIPAGTLLAKELLWTPFLPKGRYEIVYEDWSLGDHEMSWYKERKVTYFLVSTLMKDLMSYPDRPSSHHRQFYQDLEKEAEIIYRLRGKDKGLFMDFHNPTVLIYKMRDI